MNARIVLLLTLVLPLHSFSSEYQGSVNTALGIREQQVSVDFAKLWKLEETDLSLGIGLRGTSQLASGQTFKTAPANLTAGQEGPQVIFIKDKKKNIDNLTLKNTQVTSLNVAFYVLYKFNTKWSLGTNIDVVGGSFGRTSKGKYNPQRDDSSYPASVTARPSPFNLLLISDNDRGSLNSEFFVQKTISQGLGIKLGLNFAFSEYKTSKKLRNGNDRFRHKSLLPTFGLYKVF